MHWPVDRVAQIVIVAILGYALLCAVVGIIEWRANQLRRKQ
jgi:hypothetical protein